MIKITFLNLKKHNWLILLAIVIYCQLFLFQFFIEQDSLYRFKYNPKHSTTTFVYFLTIVLIMPCLEELVFRGFQSRYNFKTSFLIIFFVGSFLFALPSFSLVSILVGIFTPILFYFILRLKKDIYKKISIIYSALIFTIAHFNPTTGIRQFYFLGSHFFAAGLILSWIAINFGLFKSMLIHIIINIFSLTLYLNTGKINTIGEYRNGLSYEIERTSIFNNLGEVKRSKNSLIVKTAPIDIILHNLQIPAKKNIYIGSSIDNYSIKITDTKDKLTDKEILEILALNDVIQIR